MSKLIKVSAPYTRDILEFVRDDLVSERERAAQETDHEAPPDEAPAPAPDPAEVLAQAREEAEAKVREAYAEGYRRGEEKALAAFREKLGDADQVLHQAAAGIETARSEFMASLEPQVLGLVRQIAEKVVRHQASLDETTVLRSLRAGLEVLSDRESITVRAHPDDLAAIEAEQPALLKDFKGLEHVHYEADPAIERGGCVIETARMEVDATLSAQIARVLEALPG